MRTLLELNDVDPADMTLEELAATWKGETDPESAPYLQANGTPVTPEQFARDDRMARAGFFLRDGVVRRPFNYSTRGANAGPSPKYRKSAPEVYPATFAQLCKPTKEDAAQLAARPIVVKLRAGWDEQPAYGRQSPEAKRLLAHFAALNMTLEEVAPEAPPEAPAPAVTFLHGQAPAAGVDVAKIPGGHVVVIDVAAVARGVSNG